MQDIISFQTFADTLSVLSGLLLLDTIVVAILYFTNSKFRNLISKISYRTWMWIITAIVGAGVVGANIYEFVYYDLPCELCWYQRIVIYPMLIIAIIELIKNTRVAHYFIGVFASLTTLIAGFHYYYHFRRYVMEDMLSLPCSNNPLVPACTEAGVVSFGFVTLPALAVVIGLTILLYTFLASKKAR